MIRSALGHILPSFMLLWVSFVSSKGPVAQAELSPEDSGWLPSHLPEARWMRKSFPTSVFTVDLDWNPLGERAF